MKEIVKKHILKDVQRSYCGKTSKDMQTVKTYAQSDCLNCRANYRVSNMMVPYKKAVADEKKFLGVS